MSLPIPVLDDRTFEELFEEARKLIPIYSPRWTDHNLSDPGITFVDLFAWLTEMQIFSLDQVTDAHLLKYLALLGMSPRPASPARVELQLTPLTTKCINIPKGTAFHTDPAVSTFTFETVQDIEIIPVSLDKVVTYSGYRYTDVTEFNRHSQTHYHAFGKTPSRGDALYLGLSTGARIGSIAGKETRFAIYAYEEDLPPVGEGLPGEQDGELQLDAAPSADVAWEYWNGAEWVPLPITAAQSGAWVLSAGGIFCFNFPVDIARENPPEFPGYLEVEDTYYWLRCTVKEANYEIPPRIDRILANVVPALEGETLEESWQSTGLPGQVFGTGKSPIIMGSQVVSAAGETWQAVGDFDNSGPEDRHYLIDPVEGTIGFGNGEQGAVPGVDQTITISYRSGGGLKGNVESGAVSQSSIGGVGVVNPFAAYGGEDAETIGQAFTRFRQNMAVPYTAVTVEDYEYIVAATPGLRVARSRAVILDGQSPQSLFGLESNVNEVIVVVIPYSFAAKPLASSQFKQAVCRYLDLHRMVTTAVKVSDPDYVRISVSTQIKIKPGIQPTQVDVRIRDGLNRFLSPLAREKGDNEWPFGRPVYLSEVNEVLEGVEGVDCVISLSLSASGGKYKKSGGNIEIGPLSVVYPGTHEIEIIDPYTKCKV